MAHLLSEYRDMVTLVEADLCDAPKLGSLFSQFKFTHVVNLAAQAGVRYSLQQPRAYMRSNMNCFLELLEVLREHATTRLVFASSSSVYGANTLSPFSETNRVDSPNSLYGATKKVDHRVDRLALRASFLRMTA